MICEYGLSKKSWAHLILRLLILLLSAGILLVAFLFLSLVQWPEEAYPWVNAGQLITIVLSIFLNMAFGGKMDGKRCKWLICFVALLALSSVAVLAWFAMSERNNHFDMGVPLFIINAVVVIKLCNRTSWAFRNFFKRIGGVLSDYPGNYVLRHVPVGASITDPTGVVVIEKGVVLFVVNCWKRGFIRVTPNGYLEARSGDINRPQESSSLDMTMNELVEIGERGIAQVRTIIEEWCASNGYEPLNLRYEYMLFLPYFESKTHVFSVKSFYHTNEKKRMRRYADYVKTAEAKKGSYFKGNAAFSERDLRDKLAERWIYFRYEYKESAVSELAAEILADTYGLKPRG